MIQCPRCGASTGSKCWAWRCKNGRKGCNFAICAYEAELPEPHLERAVAARKSAQPAGWVSPAEVARRETLAKAEAWQEGYEMGMYDTPPDPTNNPYCSTTEGAGE